MIKRLLFLPLLFALALAQEERALTLDDALQLGMQTSKLLHMAEAKTMAANARSSEANAARLPSLKLQAGYTRLSDVEPFAVTLPSSPAPIVISPTVLDQYTSKMSLQQPLFTGFKLENAAAAADYSAEASRFDYMRDKVEMAFNVKSAYWNVYKAVEVQRVINENVEQTKAHLIDIENMMKQGLVTKNEALKVKVQLSNAQLAQIEAANNVKNTTMALNNLIGLALETQIRIASLPKAQIEQAQTLDALAQQALALRADVKSAEMRVNAADASVSAAKGGWLPQVMLFGNMYYTRPNPRVLPTKDEFKNTWDFGVSLSWDIWNWGTTKYQSEQAEAVYAQTQYALEQVKDNVSLEVAQSHLTLAQSKEKVRVAAMGVEQAKENYHLTKTKFTNGTATNTELLDAEIALLQSKLNYTVSLVDYELADAKRAKAMGREN